MLIQKTNPQGIDSVIDLIQKSIYDFLIGIGWSEYKSYHRVYVNYKEGQKIPEAYKGGNEYEEVLFDDKVNANSFFVLSDTRVQISPDCWENKIELYFQVKLNKLFPSISHRPDEECKLQILEAFKEFGFEDKVIDIVTGFDSVYRGFKLNDEIMERIKITDISDFHFFKFDLKINTDLCGCNLI